METKLEKAIELRKSGHLQESNEMLSHLAGSIQTMPLFIINVPEVMTC
ncbi:hypothetical protein ACUW84_001947 [Bacillus sp. 153480031-1]|nr:hypothetical protein [Bacillus sp. TBS-096]